MPASRSVNGNLQVEKIGSNVKEPVQTKRTASTHVRRYMGQHTAQPDAYRARTQWLWRHQLRLSGLGSLNGLGLARFLGLARDLDLGGAGMGKELGLGCCLHPASPTISLTSTVPTHRNVVMQNHQLETISTGQLKTARPDFLNADPICSCASRRHSFWCSPYCLRVTGYGSVT